MQQSAEILPTGKKIKLLFDLVRKRGTDIRKIGERSGLFRQSISFQKLQQPAAQRQGKILFRQDPSAVLTAEQQPEGSVRKAAAKLLGCRRGTVFPGRASFCADKLLSGCFLRQGGPDGGGGGAEDGSPPTPAAVCRDNPPSGKWQGAGWSCAGRKAPCSIRFRECCWEG